MMKGLRNIIERKADHSKKEIETMDNSIAEIKTHQETMKSRLNNTIAG